MHSSRRRVAGLGRLRQRASSSITRLSSSPEAVRLRASATTASAIASVSGVAAAGVPATSLGSDARPRTIRWSRMRRARSTRWLAASCRASSRADFSFASSIAGMLNASTTPSATRMPAAINAIRPHGGSGTSTSRGGVQMCSHDPAISHREARSGMPSG